MKLLVTGPGHSGGNWATEIARATGLFNFTPMVEDRNFFFYEDLPDKYATKLATDNLGMSWENLVDMLLVYSDMKVIFTMRHPVDNCLSKIVRGLPKDGNEPFKTLLEHSWEATINGSIKSIEIAYSIFNQLYSYCSDRLLVVKMEDLILHTEDITKKICKFIGAEYKEEYCNAYANTRNVHQQKRYKGEKDLSQIEMYKRYDTIYDGFFTQAGDLIKFMHKHLGYIVKGFGY